MDLALVPKVREMSRSLSLSLFSLAGNVVDEPAVCRVQGSQLRVDFERRPMIVGSARAFRASRRSYFGCARVTANGGAFSCAVSCRAPVSLHFNHEDPALSTLGLTILRTRFGGGHWRNLGVVQLDLVLAAGRAPLIRIIFEFVDDNLRGGVWHFGGTD